MTVDKNQFIRDLLADASTVVCPCCSQKGFWDNRTNKKSEKGPDWKCKNQSCPGATPMKKKQPLGVWIPEDFQMPAPSPAAPRQTQTRQQFSEMMRDDVPPPPVPPELGGPGIEQAATEALDERSQRIASIESGYLALYERVGHRLVAFGRANDLPIDGVAINAAAATISIALDKKGLLQ